MKIRCSDLKFVRICLIFLTLFLFLTAVYMRALENIRYYSAVPVFTGEGLDRGEENFGGLINKFILAAFLLYLCIIISVILEKKYSLSGKILRTLLRIADLFIFAVLLAFFVPSDSFEEHYYPEYYVCRTEDKQIRLLFAEGAFMFDGRTKVYRLDDDSSAYYIGSFTTDDGITNGGKYDIKREGNSISFEYDFGNGIKKNAKMQIDIPTP